MRATLNRARRAHQGDAGFTLIELLIVIVILGILAAIVVFSVRGITDRGDVAACKTSVSTLDTAFEAAIANDAAHATVSDLKGSYIHGVPSITEADGTVHNAAAVGAMDNDAVDALVCQ